MLNKDYDAWVEEKITGLVNQESEGVFDEETIREYLIFSQHTTHGKPLVEFFKQNRDNENLLRTLLLVLLDESEDYSNDARYSAAKVISQFNDSLLKKYRKELQYAQNYKIIGLKPFPSGSPSWLLGE